MFISSVFMLSLFIIKDHSTIFSSIFVYFSYNMTIMRSDAYMSISMRIVSVGTLLHLLLSLFLLLTTTKDETLQGKLDKEIEIGSINDTTRQQT